ncbi:uncharacterized protein LTR77_003346 [Saxophila tyrrhenica]|uniref:PAC domain-containing protein n=1 Tax=Saxophila tyrrhenica TaxID=1690608 RepID=A0AAV9PDP7_9PEZI|nr:hypothetical protein LTR77_003346 [Saxophila tyrrhenica]
MMRLTKKRFASSKEKKANSEDQYPHQASDGRRSLRAMEKSPDSEQVIIHDHSRNGTVDTFLGSNTDSQNSDRSNRPSVEDHAYQRPHPDRADSLPSEVLGLTPDSEKPRYNAISDSPVVSDFGDRYDSPGNSRYTHARSTSKSAASRMKYDHSVSQDTLRDNDRSRSQHKQQQPTANKQNLSSNARQTRQLSRNPSEYDQQQYSRSGSPDTTAGHGYINGDRSSAESVMSQETAATSVTTLPALQTKGPDNSDAQDLEPVLEDDPRSWDLVEPVENTGSPANIYSLEKRAEQIFSNEHLRTIFNDPKLLLKFTGFLNAHRPKSIAILIYYLDALKALRAVEYANAIAEALEPIRGQDFTQENAAPTRNSALEKKADAAFGIMVNEDLPAFVAHIWIQVVSVSIQRRITGTLAPHLREASEGLAEVFCLTDPSRTDNPIVFASEEFVRTTQYGMNYVIGRNCRFLQGPQTNPNSVRRLAMATKEGREHTEVFVNYRRDGSPFMNLLMIAPLMDSRGNVRYNIGAQVDVSGLVKDCSNLEGIQQMLEKEQDPDSEESSRKDEFQELTEMFNTAELDTVRRYGGRMHKEYADDSDRESISGGKRRVVIKDSTHEVLEQHGGKVPTSIPPTAREKINGKLEGVYQNYLLIRPAPSLRILFTSPSLRVPGILQSPFLDRIGGSSRVRSDLRSALGEGRGVTAKIRWLARADQDGDGEGRPRWIHCTPLFGHNGSVGVWMIVLVDDEGASAGGNSGKRFRAAPPVANNIGGKEWEAKPKREKQNLYSPHDARNDGLKPTDNERQHGTRREHSAVDRERGAPSRDRSAPPPGSPYGSKFGIASGDVSEFSFQLK